MLTSDVKVAIENACIKIIHCNMYVFRNASAITYEAIILTGYNQSVNQAVVLNEDSVDVTQRKLM